MGKCAPWTSHFQRCTHWSISGRPDLAPDTHLDEMERGVAVKAAALDGDRHRELHGEGGVRMHERMDKDSGGEAL